MCSCLWLTQPHTATRCFSFPLPLCVRKHGGHDDNMLTDAWHERTVWSCCDVTRSFVTEHDDAWTLGLTPAASLEQWESQSGPNGGRLKTCGCPRINSLEQPDKDLFCATVQMKVMLTLHVSVEQVAYWHRALHCPSVLREELIQKMYWFLEQQEKETQHHRPIWWHLKVSLTHLWTAVTLITMLAPAGLSTAVSTEPFWHLTNW